MSLLELQPTAEAAEVDRLPGVHQRGRVGSDHDRHPADRIDGRVRACNRGSRSGLTASHRHDPRQDRDRDLGGRLGGDVEPSRRLDSATSCSSARSPRAAGRSQPRHACVRRRAPRTGHPPQVRPGAHRAHRGRARRRRGPDRPEPGHRPARRSPPRPARARARPPSASPTIGESPASTTRGAGSTGSKNLDRSTGQARVLDRDRAVRVRDLLRPAGSSSPPRPPVRRQA